MAQFAADGVPTIDGCRPAVLRFLNTGEARQLKDIIAGVAQVMNLTQDVVDQRVRSGQGRLENRVGWACSSFFQAGLLEKVRRGWYRITEDGRTVDRRNLHEYGESDMDEWPAWRAYQSELRERVLRGTPDHAEPLLAEPVLDDSNVVESIHALVESANAVVETELRAILQRSSPEFFERAVLEVLWAMGYGGKRGTIEHQGRTGDGGIDGVIRQDPLGLQKVYMQAKRYADGNTVGSPDVNGFYGALHRRGADRGVFITTSTFSSHAIEAAEQFGGKIVLIDGITLTSLMLSYGVGVESKEHFTVYDVNRDFFED